MTLTDQRARSRPVRQRRGLRFSPVALACIGLGCVSGGALAQTSDPTQSVTITGIRRGIESSISVKRNADGIMEVISAEDIGKLPDVSIAESLSRLPGLAGQTVAGRVQQIQIRGLAGDFAGTLLNGRQQVSTGDNRAVEFDQFPSELIGQVRIYKTPQANVVGGGLSGTIDMITVRPLDFPTRAVALNARLERNSNGALNANTSVNGNRFSASYIDQFADRTVGVALGVAHLDTPSQELHYKAWGFDGPTRDCVTHPEWGGSCARGVPAGATFQNGFEVTAVSRKQTRDGLMGVFEFKPNKDLHSTVDLYYSKFKKDESMRGLMGGVGDAWGGAQGATFSNVTTQRVSASTTVVTSANVAGVANLVSRNDLNTRDDELKSAGWKTGWKIGGGWSADVDLNYSNAQRDENVIETYAGAFNGTAKALTDLQFTTPPGKGFPTIVPNLNYADAANIRLSDPAGWGHDGLWKKPRIDDTIKSLHLAGKKELAAVFSSVEFGLNYNTRGKALEMNELAADLKNNRAPVAVQAQLLQAPTSLAFGGIPGVLAFDVMGALNSIYDLKPQALDQVVNRNYRVDEKITTAFVQLGIDTSLAGVPVHGNLGLQQIHTEQSSNGFSRLSGTDTPVTRGTSYNDTLPSLNLVFDLPDSMYVRLGMAKTLARGRIDDMKAGANVSIDQNSTTGLTSWSGNGGNPQLQPWRATSYDLSFEKYFSKLSYVSLAGFYKQLSTYIYKQKLEIDFTGFPNTSNPPRATPLNPVGIYEQPANGNGGRIHGAELAASIDLGTWSSTMQGLGFQGSLSVLDNNLRPDGPTSVNKLPGFSGKSSSLSVYYEGNGFQARISQRYRSSFRGEITGLHNQRLFEQILAQRHLDAQVGYEFQSGPAKGLALLFQVNNLNNTPYATRQENGFGDAIAPSVYNSYGRQYLFGVSWKL